MNREFLVSDVLKVVYGKSPKDFKIDNGPIPAYGTGGVSCHVSKPLCSEPAILIGRKGTLDSPKLLKQPFWAIDTTFYCTATDSNVDIDYMYLLLSSVKWSRFSEASGVPSPVSYTHLRAHET